MGLGKKITYRGFMGREEKTLEPDMPTFRDGFDLKS